MTLSLVTLTDTFLTWMNRTNELVNIGNKITEGQANSSGTLSLTNVGLVNGGVTLNVSAGLIKGDAGLLSNVGTPGSIVNNKLANSFINIISNTSTLTVVGGNSANLGSTVYLNIGALSNNINDVSSSNIASAFSANLAYTAATNANIARTDKINTFVNNQTISSTDAGSASAPEVAVYRNSPSPENFDYTGQYSFDANNSDLVRKTYATIKNYLSNITAGNESGTIDFWTINGGAFAERLCVAAGLSISGATGGDQGAGTINATNYYTNGILTRGSAFIKKTVNDTRTTATLTNDTHFTFSMLANTNYLIKGRYVGTLGSTSTGIKIGLSGPAAPTSVLFSVAVMVRDNDYFAASTTSSSGSIGDNFSIAGAGDSFVVEYEIVWNNGVNPGTFVLQTAQNTTSGGTLTLLANSTFTYTVI